MLPHLLILAAGIYLGFCLGIYVSILRIRGFHARTSRRSSVISSTPEVRTLKFRVMNGAPLTHREAQHIAAVLRLQ